MDWTCRDCSESGTGLSPECRTCGSNDLELTETRLAALQAAGGAA